MSPVPGDQKGWRPIRNIDRFLQAKGGYLVALKSVLVLLLWILGPFGPPKKGVNFVMSIFLTEADFLNCSDIRLS